MSMMWHSGNLDYLSLEVCLCCENLIKSTEITFQLRTVVMRNVYDNLFLAYM